jgi:hypothetical protein
VLQHTPVWRPLFCGTFRATIYYGTLLVVQCKHVHLQAPLARMLAVTYIATCCMLGYVLACDY